MASRDAFALSHSAFNPFLYADIGPVDAAGALTVASLFGRNGHDPWAEAARLARLPTGAAVASLAAMITDAPPNAWSLPEATLIAEGLLMLLPSRGTGERPARAPSIPRLKLARWPLGPLATFAVGLAILVAVVFAWMVVTDSWRPHGPEDGTHMSDPIAREAPR